MEVLGDCFSKINRRKGYSEETETFQRCLSIVDLTYIGLGAMIGTGLFVVGGEVARNIAGPAVVVSFALGAFAALLSAYCYAEFSSHVARTGSAYVYTYISIGEMWAFIIGWNMVLEYIAMLSSVARAISATVDSVIDSKIEHAIIKYVLDGERWKSPVFEEYPDLFAGALVVSVTVLVSFGAKISSTVTIICINLLFVILLMITGVSISYGSIHNWTSEGGYFPYGFGGVLEGAAVCFITYGGFEVICISSEECVTPKKSIPVALGTSLGIVSVTYIIVSGALTYLVPYKDIVPEAAFSAAFIEEGVVWMGYIVTVGIILAGVSSLVTALYFLSRLIYALSIDGLFFKTFSTVNVTTQVPIRATILFGAISALLSIFVKYTILIKFLSIGTLCAYTIMSGAVIVLRYRPQSKDSLLENTSGDTTTLFNQAMYLENTDDIDDENVPTSVSEETGSLRNRFRNLPLLSSYEPGTLVPYALLVFALFLGIGMLIVNNIPDLLTSPVLTIFVVIVFILSLVSFAVIPLHNHSIHEGRIQVPFIPYLPAFSITLNLVLMTQLDHMTWLRFLLWIIIGLVIYGTYGYWHSVERRDSNLEDEQSPSLTTLNHPYGALNNESLHLNQH